jgi:cobalt-precorrin-5B (C1)-methyltransferase
MAPKKLRTGFTTGTAAAAAAMGALTLLLSGVARPEIEVELLTGDRLRIPLLPCRRESENCAVCSVIKDAGDDPDVTHKAEIGARVRLCNGLDCGDRPPIVITGGTGVGRVTKPGLEVPPGEPAINRGPRQMISQAVEKLLAQFNRQGSVTVEVFAPRGAELAAKTLNARLGILGGISILGTTGLVRPMSHEAYFAAIAASLSVAKACGLEHAVMTTGRRSERYAQRLRPQLPDEAFVQIGDFFQQSLEAAAKDGFRRITLAVFFGKAVKMAQGVPHTHAAKSSLSLKALAQWSMEATQDSRLAETLRHVNTAREAFEMVRQKHPQVIAAVGGKIIEAARAFAGPQVQIECVVFDYNGDVVFDSEHNQKKD